jgi:ribonuclease P protein component
VEHETHVSAKEAQASADARIPKADALPRRADGHKTAPGQGTQALDGLSYVPQRRGRGGGRLTRSGDFDRVFRNGRSHAARELVIYAFPRDETGSVRLGLSVSRKVGGAVERNRVKRLLREAFGLESGKLPEGLDVVVIARPDANTLAEREGLAGIQRVLSELLARLGNGDGRLR